MRTCTATKRNGERCTLPGVGQHGLCWAHNPKNAEKRRRGASRGGKSKPSTEIRDLKRQLEDLAEGVLEGRVDRGDGAVVNQIITTRARLIELERRIREGEEFERRLTELEASLQRQTREVS
jgi:hypothetical protein